MDTIKTKAAIAAQIEKLNASNSVTKAKSWFNSLTPMQKALAIAIISGTVMGTAVYFSTVGTVQAIALGQGQMAVATVSSTQALWNAVIFGGITAGVVGNIAHKRYTAAATPVVQAPFDIND